MRRDTPSEKQSLSHAYRIPWHVHRIAPTACILENASLEALSHVSTQLFGRGVMVPALSRGTLLPGARVRLQFRGPDVIDTAQVCVHWHRANGHEYAWTFVL